MSKETKNSKIQEPLRMIICLGLILVCALGPMILFQLNRQDPVTIHFKNAQGYLTTEIVHKNPNDTIGEVLEKATTPINSEEYVCTLDLNQKISTISDLTLYQKINGTIIIDGTEIPYESASRTVEEVLEENNISISPVDIVTPSTGSELTSENSTIVINRVSSATESKSEIIPYTVETIETDNLPYNEIEVIQPGSNGVRSYTEEVVYENGQEIERFITSDQRTTPVNEVVYVGTNLTIGKPNIEKGDIEAWRPYVIKALEENGLATSEELIQKVLRQINTESAGDQNAHQEIVDINTFLGQEARGLMQTTPWTFNYYHHEGYEDILNGYHNLLAALAYAKAEYGENLDGIGEGHGY